MPKVSTNANLNRPAFCTVRQFVIPSGLSEKAIREMIRGGALPFILCGNRQMIDVEGALAALRAQAAKGANA